MAGRTINVFHKSVENFDAPSAHTYSTRLKQLFCRSSTEPFISNNVHTARYTLLTFLPKQLYAQFSKFANLYFLFIAGLQAVPNWSPTGRFTTIIPLGLFVGLSMTREGVDDYHRHRHDQIENGSHAKRLKIVGSRRSRSILSFTSVHSAPVHPMLEWETVQWGHIQVGDILLIRNKDSIPADVIVLSSSNEGGLCYIETSNLDGETNLKTRQALHETYELLHLDTDLLHFSASVHAESPHGDLYEFEGNLELDSGDTKTKIPLSIDQFLLRGSTLRNTDYVYGLVIYTGEETKIRMNANKAIRTKAPQLETLTNRIIILLFCLVIILAIFSTLMNILLVDTSGDFFSRYWYLGVERTAVETFFSFVILYNSLIPLSLYVTMEFVKLFQIRLMEWDLSMYDEERDIPCVCRTSSLNEDLGQVEYVFTDKTGTLTQNLMKFKRFSISGESFSVEPCQDGSSLSDTLIQQLKGPMDHKNRLVYFFLEALALCHSASIDALESSAVDLQKIVYQASSPDEVALVKGAQSLGFIYKKRENKTFVVNILEKDVEYHLLDLIPFSSQRKRMSSIYRFPNGRIYLLCKGADSMIQSRLKSKEAMSIEEMEVLDKTMQLLDKYSAAGLRTLLYGYKEISEEEYQSWSQEYSAASTSLTDRTSAMETVADVMERDLTLLGSTAIEDKLQNGVPETIEKLQKANIKVWMLTGDKKGTAINIAMSCNLLKEHSKKVIITGRHLPTITEHIKAGLEQRLKADKNEHFVTVIEGDALSTLEEEGGASDHETSILQQFLCLGALSNSVVCCRFSPSQKALIVSQIKSMLKYLQDHPKLTVSDLASLPMQSSKDPYRILIQKLLTPNSSGVTLSIGDGANDIPMLESAHVGVGIAGREGLAAARASDYSISQFRYLQPLLFVHGRYNYRRVSLLTLGNFYKCVAFYTCQWFFQIWTLFSGTSLFEQWGLASFNVFFSTLPVIAMGIFDKDLCRSTLLAVPELYRYGQQNRGFNIKVFSRWIVQGLFHMLFCMLIPFGLYNAFSSGQENWSNPQFGGTFFENVFNSDISGPYNDGSIYVLGSLVYTIVIALVTFKIAFIENSSWNKYTLMAAGLSIMVWYLYLWIYCSYLYPNVIPFFGVDVHGLFFGVFVKYQLTYWSACLIAIVSCFLFTDYLYLSVHWLWKKGHWLHTQQVNPRIGPPLQVLPKDILFQKRQDAARIVADHLNELGIPVEKWSVAVEWWKSWEWYHDVKDVY